MVDLKISLPLYEGPLDLLLDLIRKQKLDIYDIPIAKITEQYLEYLHLMEEMDVDVASEFLLIAAQLIYIKSRMLLPPDPDAPPEEQEDPRAELVRRLIEYEKFKNAAQMLYQREMIENASWSNPGESGIESSDLEPELNVSLYDLLMAFRTVVKRSEERPLMEVRRDEFSVEQMMAYLFENSRGAGGRSVDPGVTGDVIEARHDHRISGSVGTDEAPRDLFKTRQTIRRNNRSRESGL